MRAGEAGDPLDRLLEELESMNESIALNPESKGAIVQAAIRKARVEGGDSRARIFTILYNILSARTNMDEKTIQVNVSGQVGAINFGTVQGSINAHVQTLAGQGKAQQD